MLDPIDAFTRQFKSVDGGYVYYPSPKAGGKFVTLSEYQRLVADWECTVGRRGQWKVMGLVVAFLALWILSSEFIPLPDWTEPMMIGLCVISITGWFFWASFAPRRLVRGRPDFAPPRLRSETKAEARAALNWRFVLLVLLLSGFALVNTMTSPERTWGWWTWLIGSSGLFAGYAWIAIQKLMDRQH